MQEEKKMNGTFNESGKNTGKCLLLKLIHQARCMRLRYGLDLGHIKQTKQRGGKKKLLFCGGETQASANGCREGR